jgi:hypothetical protein
MDRQNHLISLVAVFLSLGIGILFGASMGVNALVLNQISVIEQLQNDIQYFQGETKLYIEEVSRLNQEINNWLALEEDYLNPFFIKDKLVGYTIKVLCQGNFPGKLKEFLELTGCRYQAFLFKEGINWEEDPSLPMTSLILEKPGLINLEDILPANIKERNILTLYENDSPLFQEEQMESFNRELFFAVGMLDPFLSEAITNLSSEQKVVFFIALDPLQNDQQRVDSLPARLKLLESIQKKAPLQ